MSDCCCPSGKCRGHIPVAEIISGCDRLFNMNKSRELGEYLRYWRRRAAELGDEKGELSVLNELMGHYRMMRDENRAVAAVRDGFDLIGRLGISGSVSAGTIFINGATALQSFGMSKEALTYYRMAEQCFTANLAPDDVLFAGLFNNMASACIDEGMFQQAREYYMRALETLRTAGKLMDLAVTYVNLAQLYDALDPEDEERIGQNLDAALACLDAPEAERDGYYAHTCLKCAPAFGYFGRFMDEAELEKRAEEYYERT